MLGQDTPVVCPGRKRFRVAERPEALDHEVAVPGPSPGENHVRLAEQQIIGVWLDPDKVVTEQPGGVVCPVIAAPVVEQSRASALAVGTEVSRIDEEERVAFRLVIARLRQPLGMEAVLCDGCVATEHSPVAGPVEGLHELADA